MSFCFTRKFNFLPEKQKVVSLGDRILKIFEEYFLT